jgi:hypothetical protein
LRRGWPAKPLGAGLAQSRRDHRRREQRQQASADVDLRLGDTKEAERDTKAVSRKKMAGNAMQLLQRSKGEQKLPTFGNKGER